MKIEGQHVIPASRERVWKALNDPGTLIKATPGLKSLTPTGPDAYDAAIELAVGPVKGSYAGKVRISDKVEPDKMTITVEGGGKTGTIKATGALTLEAAGDSTTIKYVGDAQVTGVLMSVGSRLIPGVAKQMAGEFFKSLEREVIKAK
jgi:hypothetical protein